MNRRMRRALKLDPQQVADGLELNEQLKARIQANVEATGSPRDPDETWAEQMAAEHGTTAAITARYGKQVARQLHLLAPQKFERP